ncbi:MAG: ParA family protein [Lachnospiraceae bacterium]|nr:ParA family protein [Lachnospiraceae bacterium]
MKEAIIVPFINHKGGTGKTTTVSNLASMLATKNKKVLLIDTDAQANLTSYMLGYEFDADDTFNAANLLSGESGEPVNVRKNIDIIPASLDLSMCEVQMQAKVLREQILKNELDKIKAKYDYILIDCPPHLGVMTINAIVAANHVIIPTTAEPFALKGVQAINDLVEQLKPANHNLDKPMIILTRFGRRQVNKLIYDAICETYANNVFKTIEKETVDILNLQAQNQTVESLSDSNPTKENWVALTKEFISKTKA